jgi:uncharacterized DUF497 family protein
MDIRFNPAKETQNLRKHGLSLTLAEHLLWESSWAFPDQRYDYDEWRMNALVPLGGIVYHVSYVDHGDFLRVFSLRRANRQEFDTYARNCCY